MPALLISPDPDKHEYLAGILAGIGQRLFSARTREEAALYIRTNTLDTVISEDELPDGHWRDVLAETAAVARAPLLIVISRLAGERLWAEVLNLGGYDVLAEPFEKAEARRVLEQSRRHWRGLYWPRPVTIGSTYRGAA